METEFENLDDKNLDDTLAKFYCEVKREDGTDYSKSSLVGIRAGITRHLNNPPHKRNLTLGKSTNFSNSNRMFMAVIKNLKKAGKDQARHYPPISQEDLKKIREKSSFNLENPVELQQKIFFNIMMCFGRRGRENLREMKVSHITFGKDDTGSQYVEFPVNECDKNHQNSDGPQSKPRMYETGEDDCPVLTLKKYLDLLPKDNVKDYFFLKAKKNFNNEPTAYTKVQIGKNALGLFMADISLRLGLSLRYTNHSIRSTCVTELSNRGIEGRHIINVTNHKSEMSLKHYNSDNTVEQKRFISHILSGARSTTGTTTEQSSATTANATVLQCQSVVDSSTNSSTQNKTNQTVIHIHNAPGGIVNIANS